MKALAKKWRGPYGVLSGFRASKKHGRPSIEVIRRKDAAAVSEEDEANLGQRGAKDEGSATSKGRGAKKVQRGKSEEGGTGA